MSRWYIPDFIERWLSKDIGERRQVMLMQIARGKELEARYMRQASRALRDEEIRKEAEKRERESREFRRRAQEIEASYRRGRGNHGSA